MSSDYMQFCCFEAITLGGGEDYKHLFFQNHCPKNHLQSSHAVSSSLIAKSKLEHLQDTLFLIARDYPKYIVRAFHFN